jgi:predicted transcriptional regulator
MQTAKEEVIEVLSNLPDDATLEEIQYRLYVRQKIKRGIDDIDGGRFLSQENVEDRMKRWIEK